MTLRGSDGRSASGLDGPWCVGTVEYWRAGGARGVVCSGMFHFTRTGCGVGIETAEGTLGIRQIYGIGRNYAAHAAEQGVEAPERPLVFMKNINALALHGEEIVIPPAALEPENRTDFEAELGVIIGRDTKDATREAALDSVLGYCCANDVSARWWQKEGAGGQFCLGKSFDTFCPVGPGVVPAEGLGDPGDPEIGLGISCRVSGEEMQSSRTDRMLLPVGELIARLSRGTTLAAGTLILTGTPEGVGMARDPARWLEDGDEVEIEIEGIGALRNRVRFG